MPAPLNVDGVLGQLVRIQLDDAGTWRDFAGAVSDEFNVKTDSIDVTCKDCNQWRTIIASNKSATLSVNAVFTNATAQRVAMVLSFAKAKNRFRYVDAGDVIATFSGIITSVKRAGAHDGAEMFTLSIDCTSLPEELAAPSITSSLTASGSVGSAFSYTITATNSPTSYNATGLPSGLSVNTSTGVISGTPTGAATTSITISATNAGGTDTKTLVLTVASNNWIAIIGVDPASGTTNAPFKLLSDGTITQFSGGEWPNPNPPGGTSGKQQDAFVWKRPDAKLGAWVRGVGDTAITAQIKSDTTYLAGWASVSEANIPANIPDSGNISNYWSDPRTFDETYVYKFYNTSGPPTPTYAYVSTDGGTTFSSARTLGLSYGGVQPNLRGASGAFCLFVQPTATALYTAGGSAVRYTLDGWATVVGVNNPVSGLYPIGGLAFAYDATYGLIVVTGCLWTGGSTYTPYVWTFPVNQASPTWTQRYQFGSGESTVPGDVGQISIPGDGYVYATVKQNSQSATHLWRCAVTNKDSWTDVCTLTGFSGRPSRVVKASDGNLYLITPGDGVWRSTSGGAGTWAKTASNSTLAANIAVL
jgi:predicted secreted protein